MNKRQAFEDRVALIAGDGIDALDCDERAELSLLADLLADPATWAQPGAALEDAVVQAVADAPTDSVVVSHPAATVPPAARARRSRRLAGLAAAAAVIVGVGAFVAREGSHADFTSQLAATPLAPMAGGRATITHNDAGFRVTLDAHGLPKLADHEYYEAWVRDDEGTLVSLGTFSSSNGVVTLWSGVSPTEYRMLTVTVEREDNDQSASGRRVLVGTLDDA
jgi:hypothetical protein